MTHLFTIMLMGLVGPAISLTTGRNLATANSSFSEGFPESALVAAGSNMSYHAVCCCYKSCFLAIECIPRDDLEPGTCPAKHDHKALVHKDALCKSGLKKLEECRARRLADREKKGTGGGNIGTYEDPGMTANVSAGQLQDEVKNDAEQELVQESMAALEKDDEAKKRAEQEAIQKELAVQETTRKKLEDDEAKKKELAEQETTRKKLEDEAKKTRAEQETIQKKLEDHKNLYEALKKGTYASDRSLCADLLNKFDKLPFTGTDDEEKKQKMMGAVKEAKKKLDELASNDCGKIVEAAHAATNLKEIEIKTQLKRIDDNYSDIPCGSPDKREEVGNKLVELREKVKDAKTTLSGARVRSKTLFGRIMKKLLGLAKS